MLSFENESKGIVNERLRIWFAGLLFAFVTLSGSAFGVFAQIENGSKPDPTVSPEKLSASFADVSKRVESAVVNIDTKGKVPEIKAKGDESAGDSDDIMDFFKRQMPRRPSFSVGSGFIVDSAGYILTNNHVVAEASRITVSLPSGEEFVAKIVGTDEETDLAVLKIEAGRELPFLKLGDQKKPGWAIGFWLSVHRSVWQKRSPLE